VIANRVYLGEAKSGEYVKQDAHPALVSDKLFRRANRRRTERSVSYGGREGALLGGKIMRCGSCGYAISKDTIKKTGVSFYRCKNLMCPGRVSINADKVEPYVFLQALAWHATTNSMHIADMDAAAVPVFEEELAKAQAEVAEIER